MYYVIKDKPFDHQEPTEFVLCGNDREFTTSVYETMPFRNYTDARNYRVSLEDRDSVARRVICKGTHTPN